jgi:hypothetical protein
MISTVDLERYKASDDGQIAYIVGKGPSAKDFRNYGDGIVIALNESIEIVESLGLTIPIFSFQKDGRSESLRRPKGAILVLSHDRSRKCHLGYPYRAVFNTEVDWGLKPETFSARCALEFVKGLGYKTVMFVGFDAQTVGDVSYYDSSHYYEPKNTKELPRHGSILAMNLGNLFAIWVRPDGSTYSQKQGDYTAITLTGDRLWSFDLCRKYVTRQSLVPRKWIVVDDGKVALNWKQVEDAAYIRRQPQTEISFIENLCLALEAIETENVLIFEDDDWYGSNHALEILRYLIKDDLVGVHPPIYYNPAVRAFYDFVGKLQHASFAATGFNQSCLPLLKTICAAGSSYFVDINLWHQYPGRKRLIRPNPLSIIGVKGVPGRGGIGSGHNVHPGFKFDFRGERLRKLIGDDADPYLFTHFPVPRTIGKVRVTKNEHGYTLLRQDTYAEEFLNQRLVRNGPLHWKETNCQWTELPKI